MSKMMALVLASVGPVFAGAMRVPEPLPAIAPARFATVDMARVLREWEAVLELQKRLISHGCGFQERPDAQQQRLKALTEKVKTARDPEERQQLEKARKALLTALQNSFQELKDRLQNVEKDQFEALKARIQVEIDNLAASRKLDMVIEKQWLYYPRQTQDITDDLLKALGKK